MPADATILTTEYKINLVAPARGEALVARARVKKAGRTLTVVECDVFGQEGGKEGGKETAVAHLLATMLCLHGKTDNPRASRDTMNS
jgi:acyl-coenzyme A thioesterase PaaI-like protein